jgi:hypothetical protein
MDEGAKEETAKKKKKEEKNSGWGLGGFKFDF